MKKLISIIALCALTFTHHANAQSWSKTGNSGTDPAINFIGTTDSKAFKIRTSNLERVTVSSSGKVGIGTTAPDAKLHIKNAGNTKVTLMHIENTNKLNDSNMVSLSTIGYGTALSIKGDSCYNPIVNVNVNGGSGAGIQIKNSGTGDGIYVFGYNSTTSPLIRTENYGTGSSLYMANQNNTSTEATLNVYTNGSAEGGLFTSTNALPYNAIVSAKYLEVTSSTTDKIAVKGESIVNDGWGIGGLFTGGYIGSKGTSIISSINASEQNFGAQAIGTNHGTGYCNGIYAEAAGNGVGPKYGVFGVASGNGNYKYAGYFAGNLAYTGNFSQTSDRKLKNNIQPVTDALNKIMLLKPSSYTFKTDEFKTMNLATGKHFGLIAQELQQVFPEMVTENSHPAQYDAITKIKVADEVKYLGVNYTELIPVLIEGMQEQQKQIVELKNEIAGLKNASRNRISAIQSTNTDSQPGLKNNPNPFSDKTAVECFVPADVLQSEIKIYDVNGKKMKSIIVSQRGIAKVEITADGLTNGTYIYQIVADGKIISSDKMTVLK